MQNCGNNGKPKSATWPCTHMIGDGVCVSVTRGDDHRYTWSLWLAAVHEDDFYAWNERGNDDREDKGRSFETVGEVLDHCCKHVDMFVGRVGRMRAAASLRPVEGWQDGE